MANKTEIFASFNDFLNRADKKINGVSSEFAERNPNYARDNETNIGCWDCKSCVSCKWCVSCMSCESCVSCKWCESCGSCMLCESCVSCKWCESCGSCKWCESCMSCLSCVSCESGVSCVSCESCVSCVACVSCVSCKWCESCVSCMLCESCVSCKWCESCVSCKSCESCESCVSCMSCESCVSCESFSYELKNRSGLKVPLVQNIHQSVFNATSAENTLDMNDWHVCETTHCRAGWVVHLAGKAGYALEKLTSTPFAAMAIYNKSSDIKVPLHMFYVDNDESLTDIKRCAELELDLPRPT